MLKKKKKTTEPLALPLWAVWVIFNDFILIHRRCIQTYMHTHTHTHTHTHSHMHPYIFFLEERDLKWDWHVVFHPQWGGETVFRMFYGCSRASRLVRAFPEHPAHITQGAPWGTTCHWRRSAFKTRSECRAGCPPNSGMSRVLSPPQRTAQDSQVLFYFTFHPDRGSLWSYISPNFSAAVEPRGEIPLCLECSFKSKSGSCII